MDDGAAPNAAYVIYMLACLALFAAVHALRLFDLRGVGQVRRRRADADADELEFDAGELRTTTRPEAVYIIPRADLAMIAVLMALAAVAVGALLGFWGPRAIDQALGRGGPWLFDGAWVGLTPLERVAQATGALCGGLIALRMLRVFMAVAALALVALALNVATNFVLGRETLIGLG